MSNLYKSYAEAAAAVEGKVADSGTSRGLVRTRCFYCEREGNIVLKCAQHKLCQKCFPRNIAQFGTDEESMYRCPAVECAVPDTPLPPIWIFVDNSNIWIGAKYLANKVKGFKSSKDHRVRLNIGKLTDVVSKKRRVKKGMLYGSEPPQIDSVWEKIREHKGWDVQTKKKSFLTHKEKEVDAQLLVDVTELACTTPRSERSTIVLITGDADMCPAVEKIMEYEGWKVEIYMWEDSLSDRLKLLSKKNEDVSCQPLDNHMTDVIFTNKRFPVDHSEIPADSSAVLTMKPNQFPKRIVSNTWWNQLESIVQWPVQYWWIIRDGEETDDLLLVFSHHGETRKYNVSSFVQKINDHELDSSEEPILPHVVRAETYVDYNKRRKKYEEVVKYGFFDSNDLESESNFLESPFKTIFKRQVFKRECDDGTDSTIPNTSSTGEKFKSVPPSQVGGQFKTCRFGKNCVQGLDCEFKHSEKDRIYFLNNNGKGNSLRKTRLCKKYPSCQRDPDKCDYAHGERDGWCLNCRQRGHFSKACPNPTQ